MKLRISSVGIEICNNVMHGDNVDSILHQTTLLDYQIRDIGKNRKIYFWWCIPILVHARSSVDYGDALIVHVSQSLADQLQRAKNCAKPSLIVHMSEYPPRHNLPAPNSV